MRRAASRAAVRKRFDVMRIFCPQRRVWNCAALGVALLLALWVTEGRSQTAPRPTIENVQFRGNRRVPAATLRTRIFTKPGDDYDDNALRRDFMALYNTGMFEDIVLRVEDGERGKVVTFEFKDRKSTRLNSSHSQI